MLHDKVLKALNQQINAEAYSAYLYMAMSADFADKGLLGFANWTRVQAQEELLHASKFFDFIVERGGRVALTAIDGPPKSWKSPEAAFKDVMGHEEKITGMINDLVNLSIELKDHATGNMLQWFVAEQVEEEANANEVLHKTKMAGDGPGLFFLDNQLAARVYTPPAAAAQ